MNWRCCAASSAVNAPATSRALHLSVKTVSTHKARIMDKLQLDSTAALVRYGIEQGLDGGLNPADAELPG